MSAVRGELTLVQDLTFLTKPADALTPEEAAESFAVVKGIAGVLKEREGELRQRVIDEADEHGTVKKATTTWETDGAVVKVTRPKDKEVISEGGLKELLEEKGIDLNKVYDTTLSFKAGGVTAEQKAELEQAARRILGRNVNFEHQSQDVLNKARLEGLLALGMITPDEADRFVTNEPATPRLSVKPAGLLKDALDK